MLVGTAMTGVGGTYTVSVPVAKLMPEASFGVVNLEADTKTAMFGFPVVVTKTPGDAYLAGSHPVVNLISTPRDDNHGCGAFGVWHYDKQLGKHFAVVGETYVPTSHATQQFTYERGQSSSLGWGLSAGVKGVSWSQSGTYSRSSTFKEPFPTFGPTVRSGILQRSSGRSTLARVSFIPSLASMLTGMPGEQTSGSRPSSRRLRDGSA